MSKLQALHFVANLLLEFLHFPRICSSNNRQFHYFLLILIYDICWLAIFCFENCFFIVVSVICEGQSLDVVISRFFNGSNLVSFVRFKKCISDLNFPQKGSQSSTLVLNFVIDNFVSLATTYNFAVPIQVRPPSRVINFFTP